MEHWEVVEWMCEDIRNKEFDTLEKVTWRMSQEVGAYKWRNQTTYTLGLGQTLSFISEDHDIAFPAGPGYELVEMPAFVFDTVHQATDLVAFVKRLAVIGWYWHRDLEGDRIQALTVKGLAQARAGVFSGILCPCGVVISEDDFGLSPSLAAWVDNCRAHLGAPTGADDLEGVALGLSVPSSPDDLSA